MVEHVDSADSDKTEEEEDSDDLEYESGDEDEAGSELSEEEYVSD